MTNSDYNAFEAPVIPPRPPIAGQAPVTAPDASMSASGGKGPAVINKKIPESQFHSGLEDKLPDLDLTPLEELKTKITPEYCLEQAARVLEEWTEDQEDPTWVDQMIRVADQWKIMAEMLINYKVQIHQLAGDAHLKQQEMYFARDLHAQTLAHNDQKHMQSMTQADQQHKVSIKQGEDKHKVDLDVTKKKGELTLKQQQEKAAAAKKIQKTAAPKKTTPKLTGGTSAKA